MPSHRPRRLLLPEAPRLNYAILTGTLTEDPRPGRSPVGRSVCLLRIEFPVADPEHPELLLTSAGCEIEVPDALADRHGVRDLEGGAPILAAGQLSERWAISGGRSSRRAALVAALIRPEQRAYPQGLLVPGGGS
ncbi:MAG TPA: hypothetical protein VFJ57_07655 [Solirubrobacterales bacterium]|nr:hypothetical protein [Solirubrobacterales bacterium]